MAYRCTKLLRIVRITNVIRHNFIATSVALPEEDKIREPKEYKTEDNLVYLEDPDNFGTLSRTYNTQTDELKDEGDIQEQKFLENKPLPFQKLTTKQYADLIKQYLKHKRLKEAIDVLEVRMLKEDRVKPENYIYNILIGACADVGYTKKAFSLFNDMKRRALRPTGDTYTCLFQACANSPWPIDGLKRARHLKELMIDKGYEPNLTNYNAMIKAFGRCGDLPTAFKIVDELIAKKIKVKVHTLNHLLHACISDKQNGLRHALIVWRKMLKMKERPNIYTFNLLLKCVKDCNLGSKQDIEELIQTIHSQIQLQNSKKQLALGNAKNSIKVEPENQVLIRPSESVIKLDNITSIMDTDKSTNVLTATDSTDNIIIQFVNKSEKVIPNDCTVPNLLSKVLNMEQVSALREVYTLQDKFAVIGGEEGFFKEMQTYSVKPDIKTFTQMLLLLDNTLEAEDKLLQKMKTLEIKADIDFYNMLIKKRCLRSDYDAASDVKEIISKETEFRKKRYPNSKKLKLKVNIITYGVLAMGCKTKEHAEKLLNEMEEKRLKVNIEILGTLLRQGTVNSNFGYVLYIMNVVKKENMKVNHIFLKHLEDFNDKCNDILKDECSEVFKKTYDIFSKYYTAWLRNVHIEEALKPIHPWQQFRETYPETVQRDQVQIKQPKTFYKRNKKFVRYTPRIVN